MAVAGIPRPSDNHPRMAAELALEMIDAVRQLPLRLPEPFSIRVGLHSGPVMAGVIGTRKFTYDVWGDTVNIAARMEAASQPNHVLSSASTAKALVGDFILDGPQRIPTKEERVMEAFFVKRRP
jgi:adenylate cyclase